MGEGTLAKRKRVATLKAPGGPPGALPGAPEAPEAAGSASKGKEGRVWQEALMPCRGGAEAEETGRHTRGEPSSNFTSDSWIPEKDFEGSLVHIPRIIPFQGAPRQSTLSVALPASIVANAQSLEMKAALVGQVARTLTIMGVDEVVVYEDEDLKFAGLQNPLDAPHHLRRSEWLPYREGVVTEGAPSEGGGCLVDCGLAHPVECLQQIPPGTRVTLRLHPGMRGVGDGSTLSPRQRKAIFRGEAVSSQEPPERAAAATAATAATAAVAAALGGLYWGYRVRAASSLRGVFSGHNLSSESRGLYDCLVGTSERGLPLEDVAPSLQAGSYKHLLVVFGGLKGLEAAVRDSQSEICPSVARQATHHCLEGDRGDTSAAEVRRACRRVAQQAGPGGPLEAFAKGETEALPPSCLFDYFVNTCPLQASRTIRAEEALLVSLAAIRQAGIHSRGPPKHQDETMRVECVKGKKRRPHVPPLIRVMLELQAKSQKQ
ncbi:hypothetical protein Emag_003886 [Eimeria magna]